MSTRIRLNIVSIDNKKTTRHLQPIIVKSRHPWSLVYRIFAVSQKLPSNYRVILYYHKKPIAMSSDRCVGDTIRNNKKATIIAQIASISHMKIRITFDLKDEAHQCARDCYGGMHWEQIHKAFAKVHNIDQPESIALYYHGKIIDDNLVADTLAPYPSVELEAIIHAIPCNSIHIGSQSQSDDAELSQTSYHSDECNTMSLAYKAMRKLKIPSDFNDKANDYCFCRNCHSQRREPVEYLRGSPRSKYVLPIGWTRFGLKVPKGKCKMNNVWQNWHVAYHGCSIDTAREIFKSGLTLLKPGDVTINGQRLRVGGGHIKKPFRRKNEYSKEYEQFDPSNIFVSPSIKYASSDYYAKPFNVDSGRGLRAKCVFQLRIRPGSYSIGQETIGATEKDIIVDTRFSNSELEWYTKENIGICVYGLCIKLIQEK
eukprot:159596_1